MQIVIDIPEEAYKLIQNDGVDWLGTEHILNAVANGTPLPKGRGRLIILSEDTVKRELERLSFSCQKWISEVGLSKATVAIIEADKAESEG